MSIEAMKQALEAFEALQRHGDIAILVTPEREFNFARISKELHQAIADLEKQEPVAQHNVCIECRNADSWGLPDKPICRECVRNSKWQPLNESSTNPVYTQPQPKREPLTREDLWKMWCNAKAKSEYLFWWEFARSIEAAHGIKE